MPDVEYVVQPQGELDIATVPALRSEWLQAADHKQLALFIVDLRDVTYLDSTALGAIVAVRKHQERHGGTVIVTNADPAWPSCSASPASTTCSTSTRPVETARTVAPATAGTSGTR
jgi:anti-anti-sigma factor